MVEIMVAMVIALALIGGAISISLANKQTYRVQDGLSQIQENGRFVFDTLEFRIRMAGYAGCYGELSSGVENILNDQTSFAWDLSESIEGFNNVATSNVVGGISGFTSGTDVLVLKGMGDGVPLNVASDTSQFKIDKDDNRFEIGELLLVTDCDQASVFHASDISTSGSVTTLAHIVDASMTPGNNVGTLTNLYDTDAEIARLETFIYYISTGSNGQPALFQAGLVVIDSDNDSVGDTVALQSTELAPNVENMQIVYGVDSDSDRDADTYQDADSVTDWQQVISVRLSLLVASDGDNLSSEARSYSFDSSVLTYTEDDTPSANADQRLRRVFNVYGAIRNRTL